MIRVTNLSNKEIIINAEQIEFMEEVPECVITLISGNKFIVRESADEVISRIITYKNRIIIAKV